MNRQRIAQRLLSANLAEPAVLIRETGGRRNRHGEYQEISQPKTLTDIVVVSAPVSGEERLTLPEGLREQDLRMFWLKHDIIILDDNNSGDVVEFLGKQYRAVVVEKWGGGITQMLGRAPVT